MESASDTAAHQLLFENQVPFVINSPDREERKVDLTVHLSVGRDTAGTRQQALRVRLTDEGDHFFLFTMEVKEDDFQMLKQEQDFLVDFATFPTHIIELVEHVVASKGEDTPRYIAKLSTENGSTKLRLVETNQFRHLTHLCLQMFPGDNQSVKKYLSARLHALKSANAKLEQELNTTAAELRTTREEAEREQTTLRSECASLKDELANAERKHEELRMQERQAMVEEERRTHRSMEQDKREMERSLQDKLTQLEAADLKYRKENAALREEKAELDGSLREMTVKATGLQRQLETASRELEQLRDTQQTLDSTRFEQERNLHENAVALSTLRQQVQDKEETASKLSSLVEATQCQKSHVEETLAVYKATNAKLEDKLRVMTSEIGKGNDIIKTLQSDLRASKGKLKSVKAEQKALGQRLHDRETAFDKLQLDMSGVRRELAASKGEVADLEGKLAAAHERLEEDKRLLKSNESTIEWLNKMANQKTISSNTFYSSALTYRPPPSLSANLASSASSQVGISSAIGGTPSPALASRGLALSGGALAQASSPSSAGNTTASTTASYPQHVVFKATKGALDSMASASQQSSPMSALALHHYAAAGMQGTPIHTQDAGEAH